MKILVDLNSAIECFQICDNHKSRLVEMFPQHEFVFLESYKDLKERVADAEAALVWIFPEHLFSKAEKLKSLYTPAAGKDWVAVDSSAKVVTHFSKFHGEMIAESFLSMALYWNNQLPVAVQNQRERQWKRNAFSGRRLLKGQSLLILGYGSIGRKCAAMAAALGMSVTGVSRFQQSTELVPIIRPEQVVDEIGQFGHILNVLPGGAETERFVDDIMIAAMKEGACFYNFGRGTTVDQDALTNALKSHSLAFAGLDVTFEEPLQKESELWSLDNVLVTPHSSCCYEDYLDLFIDELGSKL